MACFAKAAKYKQLEITTAYFGENRSQARSVSLSGSDVAMVVFTAGPGNKCVIVGGPKGSRVSGIDGVSDRTLKPDEEVTVKYDSSLKAPAGGYGVVMSSSGGGTGWISMVVSLVFTVIVVVAGLIAFFVVKKNMRNRYVRLQ